MRPGSRSRCRSRLNVAIPVIAAFATACDASFSSLVSRSIADSTSFLRRSTETVPMPISIAPSQYWEGNDGPWSTFPIQVGSNAQSVRVLVSTAGYNVWTILPEGCPSFYPATCKDDRGELFDPTQSTTWDAQQNFVLGIEQNLGVYSSGAYGFDTVTMGWPGSGGPSFNKTVIATIADEQFYLGSFGINPMSTNLSDLNNHYSSFLQSLAGDNKIAGLSYGYTAGNQYRFNKVLGSLTLGGFDTGRFDQSKALSLDMGDDSARDLVVVVQSITTNASSTALSSSGFYAFVDSTVPHLWLPKQVCEAFEQAFGLVYDSKTGLYLVSPQLHASLLQKNPSVTLKLGSRMTGGPTTEIEMPYSAFDLNVSFPIVAQGQSSYYFPLKRAANDTQYTLGRAFLQEAYLIADYNRGNFTVAPCTWTPEMTSSLQTISPPSKSDSGSKPSIGMIVGVVVGAVALIAAAGALVWLLRKRRAEKANKKRGTELWGSASTPTPFKSSGSDSPTVSSVREMHPSPWLQPAARPIQMNSELGGVDTQIHEMSTPSSTYPQTARAHELESPENPFTSVRGYNEVETATPSSAEGRAQHGYFAPPPPPPPSQPRGLPRSSTMEGGYPRSEYPRSEYGARSTFIAELPGDGPSVPSLPEMPTTRQSIKP